MEPGDGARQVGPSIPGWMSGTGTRATRGGCECLFLNFRSRSDAESDLLASRELEWWIQEEAQLNKECEQLRHACSRRSRISTAARSKKWENERGIGRSGRRQEPAEIHGSGCGSIYLTRITSQVSNGTGPTENLPGYFQVPGPLRRNLEVFSISTERGSSNQRGAEYDVVRSYGC
jgi:hypothetical protein